MAGEEDKTGALSTDPLASLPPTAPGGGEFGAPVTTRTDTIDDSHLSGPPRLKLKIQPAPPQYPYAETFFNLEVYVVDQHEAVQRGEELPLSVSLAHYVSNNPAPEGTLVVDSSNPSVMSKSGNCKMRVKITDDKSSVERRRFRLKVEAVGRPDIEAAVTEKMTVVRNRLVVRENPENRVPDQWYKDEGGRENCVELQVHLLGASGEEIKSRRVPLRLILMYENMHRVHNQEILKLSPDSKLVIDEHGKATLRVRIEEVSKNHQKQAFRIKVEPDVQEQPMSMDISSVVSKPITVLSKRIKNNKTKRAIEASGAKRDPGYVTSISRADQSSLERRVNFNELMNPTPGALDTTNVSLYEALKSVIEWTGEVVNGLQAVQWQLLGYESKADGQPDHERPLYNMKNPNPVVNKIVRRYATDTMSNLHVLLKRIEAGNFDDPVPGGNPATSSAGAGVNNTGGGTGAHTPGAGSVVHPPMGGASGQHILGPPGVSPGLAGQPWESRSPGLSGAQVPQMGSGHGIRGPSGGSGRRPLGGMSPRSQFATHASNAPPSSKRARVAPPVGGPSGNGKMPSPPVGNSNGGGAGTPGSGGRPTPPPAGAGNTTNEGLEEPPQSIPQLNQTTLSHMDVSAAPSGGGGGSGIGGGGDAASDTRHLHAGKFPSPFSPRQMMLDEGMAAAGGRSGGGPPSSLGPRSREEMSQLPTGVTDPSEVNVFYILAKGYLSHELGMLGFPAYDRSMLLLGFYKEVQSQGGQTQVVFIPAHRISHLDDNDTAATTEILRDERRKGSQSIISLDNCGGSLEKMREDAFMYYWSKSMIIDMESNEGAEQQGAV